MGKKTKVPSRHFRQSKTTSLGDKFKEPSRLISSRLLNITVISAPLAFLSVFFLPNYFSISAGDKMIFSPADGNCVSGASGFGNHCFGDYGATINLIREVSNPWFEGSALGHYPPINVILFRFFSDIQTTFSHTFALSLYLLTLLLSGLFPIWRASRKYDSQQRQSYIIFLGVLALPLLAAIDRGNPAVWAIPFLYLAVTRLLEGRLNSSIVFLGIAIAIRPQLVIFLILFLLSRKYLAFLKTITLAVILYILSFSIYLLSFDFKTLVIYFQNTRQYGSGIPGMWPPNLSLARGLKVFLEWFSIEANDNRIILISIFLIVCVLFCLFFLREPFRVRNSIILLIPLIFLSAPMTWYYYGAFLSIALAILIKERVHVDELFHQQNLTHTYLGGLIITNSVLFLPILNDYNNISQYLVPVYWLVFYISFVGQSLPSILRFGLRRNVAK